jgi:hypothetical protein
MAMMSMILMRKLPTRKMPISRKACRYEIRTSIASGG